MKERSKMSLIVLIIALVFSVNIYGSDLFDLEGGSEEGQKKESTEETTKKESVKEDAPKTATLSVEKAAKDTEAEKELRKLSVTKKKKIKVVQRKEFLKDGRMEIGVGAGMISGDWDNVISGGAHIGYHFNEHFALMGKVFYGAASTERDTKKQVTDEVIANISTSNLSMAGGLSLVMTTFYGKFSVFGNFIPKYDLNVSFGGYVYEVRLANDEEDQKEMQPAVNVGVGGKIFLTDMFSLDINWDWFMLQDKRFGGGEEATSKKSYLKTDLLFTVNISMLI